MIRLHYFMWVGIIFVCLGFGMFSAAYKDVAINDAVMKSEVTSIVKYVDQPQKAVRELGEIRI